MIPSQTEVGIDPDFQCDYTDAVECLGQLPVRAMRRTYRGMGFLSPWLHCDVLPVCVPWLVVHGAPAKADSVRENAVLAGHP